MTAVVPELGLPRTTGELGSEGAQPSGVLLDELSSVPEPLVTSRVRRTPWLTVGLLAGLLALADGYWLTSLQGAIGAVTRSQRPFATWMTTSAVLLPLFVLVILGA